MDFIDHVKLVTVFQLKKLVNVNVEQEQVWNASRDQSCSVIDDLYIVFQKTFREFENRTSMEWILGKYGIKFQYGMRRRKFYSYLGRYGIFWISWRSSWRIVLRNLAILFRFDPFDPWTGSLKNWPCNQNVERLRLLARSYQTSRRTLYLVRSMVLYSLLGK